MTSHYYPDSCISVACFYLKDPIPVTVDDATPIHVGMSLAYPTVPSPIVYIVLLVFLLFKVKIVRKGCE